MATAVSLVPSSKSIPAEEIEQFVVNQKRTTAGREILARALVCVVTFARGANEKLRNPNALCESLCD